MRTIGLDKARRAAIIWFGYHLQYCTDPLLVRCSTVGNPPVFDTSTRGPPEVRRT